MEAPTNIMRESPDGRENVESSKTPVLPTEPEAEVVLEDCPTPKISDKHRSSPDGSDFPPESPSFPPESDDGDSPWVIEEDEDFPIDDDEDLESNTSSIVFESESIPLCTPSAPDKDLPPNPPLDLTLHTIVEESCEEEENDNFGAKSVLFGKFLESFKGEYIVNVDRFLRNVNFKFFFVF